ncbi:hypothetical protein BC829DRAFT_208918 [Chytridium lagenaria]|nr:hypothetical protein BC829DRAFT_208918 [Chytridium lagenaria]
MGEVYTGNYWYASILGKSSLVLTNLFLVAKKEHTETRARIEIKTLSASLEKMTMERDHVSKEYEALSQQFQKFHSDAEAEKEVKNLKIEKMAKMLEESEGRYNNLRAHAEERLESANVEISKVRGMLEKETSTLRTKVTMAELHIASLEKTLESKTEENVELSKICESFCSRLNLESLDFGGRNSR